MPCIDYKDNYEGDCDDDEYDKEKQDNPNRWKTSIGKSTTKHTSRTIESSLKLPRQNKNPPRKEKTVQKRRVYAEKMHVKCTHFYAHAHMYVKHITEKSNSVSFFCFFFLTQL